MVAPITGPISQDIDTADSFLTRKRYKQRRPYNLVLNYSASQSKVISRSPGFNFRGSSAYQAGWSYQTEVNQVQALAFERLKAAVSDRASMGENIGQLGASARLVAEKAGIVLDALRRLRRFDVSAFSRWMDSGFVKRNSKFAANLTLEINFAIKPSIDDIYSAINILQNPVKDSFVRGRARVQWASSQKSTGANKGYVVSGYVRAEYGAIVGVTNPNLHLADTMGLINPVQIAWQLLPGSFLIDWFVPVEQFLGSATDFCGLTMLQSYSTVFGSGHYYENWLAYGWQGHSTWCDIKRVPGITLPSLAFRPLKNPSLKRAANAVSLLVQAFSKR